MLTCSRGGRTHHTVVMTEAVRPLSHLCRPDAVRGGMEGEACCEMEFLVRVAHDVKIMCSCLCSTGSDEAAVMTGHVPPGLVILGSVYHAAIMSKAEPAADPHHSIHSSRLPGGAPRGPQWLGTAHDG